jgi:hypothetical protein
MTNIIASCGCGFKARGSLIAVISNIQSHSQEAHDEKVEGLAVLDSAHALTDDQIPEGKEPHLQELSGKAIGSLLGLASRAIADKRTSSPSHQTSVAKPISRDPIASKELTTRGFVEMGKMGDFDLSLEVDNLRTVLFNASSRPLNFRGYYDLTRIPMGKRLQLLDDEKAMVPLTVERIQGKPLWVAVRVEFWETPPKNLQKLSPWRDDPFK